MVVVRLSTQTTSSPADTGRRPLPYRRQFAPMEHLLDCRTAQSQNPRRFLFGPLYPLSREELLAPEAPAGMRRAYRHLEDARPVLNLIFQGKDSLLILRRLRDWIAQEIEASLRAAFVEADSTIPLDVLANYLAGAQIALV